MQPPATPSSPSRTARVPDSPYELSLNSKVQWMAEFTRATILAAPSSPCRHRHRLHVLHRGVGTHVEALEENSAGRRNNLDCCFHHCQVGTFARQPRSGRAHCGLYYLPYFSCIARTYQDKLNGLKVPVLLAAFIHLAFLASFVGICFALRQTPFLPFLNIVLPLLAFLEMRWIFGPGRLEFPQLATSQTTDPNPATVIQPAKTAPASTWVPVTPFFSAPDAVTPVVEATGPSSVGEPHSASAAYASLPANAEEYEEFLKHLYLNKRPHRRPGSSLHEEFQRWRAARAKEQARARA